MTHIRKAFGSDSQVERWWPIPDETMSPAEARAILVRDAPYIFAPESPAPVQDASLCQGYAGAAISGASLSRLAKAQRLLAHLNEVPAKSLGADQAQRVFIGHG